MYNNIALLIGHFVGDYLFQNHKMAVEKSEPTIRGWYYCMLHCIVYSLCVSFFVVLAGWHSVEHATNWGKIGNYIPDLVIVFLIAYITHFPIDRWSLASKWMKIIKQTGMELIENPHMISPRSFFVAPVYIAVDNTMHIVLMWLLLSWLGK